MAKFCPDCGKNVNPEGPGHGISENRGSKAAAEMANIRPKYWVMTTASGIISMVFAAIIFLEIPAVHLIGIVLGILAIVYSKNGQRNY